MNESEEISRQDIKSLYSQSKLGHLKRRLLQQQWFRASPVFFFGTVATAAGTTVYPSDAVLFIGMSLMGLGVVAMWVAETGRPTWKSVWGPIVFVAGSIASAMSMTLNPSDLLLCVGMMLTGVGTVWMWVVWVAEWGINTALVVVLFTAGVTMEAISLTIVPSGLMTMLGMIATGIGAFAMWAYETDLEGRKDEELAEAKAAADPRK